MTEEFRPSFGRGLTVLVAAAAVLTECFVIVTSGPSDALLTAPWLALVVTCCWAVFWRPRVIVTDAGVKLVNVTRTIDVPWPAVEAVDTRFALTLHTAYGRFAAWAAPAAGAGAALRSSMRMRSPAGDDRNGARPSTSTVGDLEGTPSGDAALIVRRRWEQLRRDGFLDDPRLEFDRLPMCWHWRVGASVGALGLASAVTLLVI